MIQLGLFSLESQLFNIYQHNTEKITVDFCFWSFVGIHVFIFHKQNMPKTFV